MLLLNRLCIKIAARDVSTLKEKTWGLENKVIELQNKLDEQVAENKRMKAVFAVARYWVDGFRVYMHPYM